MPWQTETKGFQGVEHRSNAIRCSRAKSASWRCWCRVANQVIVAEVELVARRLESTKLLDGSQDLLHIDLPVDAGRGAKGKGIQTSLDRRAGQNDQNVRPRHRAGKLSHHPRASARAARRRWQFDLDFDMLVKVATPVAAGRPDPGVSAIASSSTATIPRRCFPKLRISTSRRRGPNTAEIVVTAPHYDDPTPDDGDATSDSPPTRRRSGTEQHAAKRRSDDRGDGPRGGGEAQDPLAVGPGAGSLRPPDGEAARTFHRCLPRPWKSPIRTRGTAPSTPCCWRRWPGPARCRPGWWSAWSMSRGARLRLSHVDRDLRRPAAGCRSTPRSGRGAIGARLSRAGQLESERRHRR